MASDWKTVNLGEILTLQRGHDLPSQKRLSGNVPVISSSGITDYHNEPAAQGPGVITGRYGTIGEVFYSDADYWPLNTTLYVKDFKGNNPKYIYYLLKTIDFHQFNDKSSVPGVNRNHAHMAMVKVADARTQIQIAEMLSSLDEKIKINRQMNRTLEQMARAMFKSWFIDFDPVHAKQRGEQPAGMDTETAALFPDRLVEIDGKEVPEGWRIGELADIIEFNPSLKLSKGMDSTYLDMGNMPTQGPSANGWFKRPFASGSKYQNGDTLFARITPCLENGKAALVDFLESGEVGWGSTEYIVMRPKKATPTILPYMLTRNENFRDFAITNMNGSSGRQRVSHQSLSRYPTAIPSREVFDAFERVTRPVLAFSKVARDESNRLAELRDLLLPRLLSGELDVSDWGNALEAPEGSPA